MANRIRTIIVDDEELARERIRTLLARVADVEIVGEASNGQSALALIADQQPELVFLDVQMPEMDGFELIRHLPEPRPQIVFVTAHDKFAVQAFEVHAVDYLLKPFDRERFETALGRAVAKIRSHPNGGTDFSSLLKEVRPSNKPLTRLLVKTEGKMLLVNLDDIDWIESSDNYVTLHLGNESRLMRETMSSLETRLPPAKFLRISRSTIVNVERIKELQPMFHGEYIIILRNGARLTLTRGYREKLNQLIETV